MTLEPLMSSWMPELSYPCKLTIPQDVQLRTLPSTAEQAMAVSTSAPKFIAICKIWANANWGASSFAFPFFSTYLGCCVHTGIHSQSSIVFFLALREARGEDGLPAHLAVVRCILCMHTSHLVILDLFSRQSLMDCFFRNTCSQAFVSIAPFAINLASNVLL